MGSFILPVTINLLYFFFTEQKISNDYCWHFEESKPGARRRALE